jgi:hypothetical protein
MKKGKRKKHYQGRSYHHLIPKSRNGEYTPSNLLLMQVERHKIWHKLFGNRTLSEVINLLIRLKKLKEVQSGYV